MSRRRPTPWIQRWSRPILGAIAILGILNTGYLTATKLLAQEAACPTQGCEQVLASPYATVLGLPLSLYGLLAYTAMAIFALAPLAVNPEEKKSLRTNLENWTWLLLFAGSTAMLVFSGYLMNIMVSKFVVPYGIKGVCYYCVGSALSAFSLFVVTLLGRAWEDVGQLLFTGVIVGMVTLVGTLGIYSGVEGDGVRDRTLGPPVTTVSTSSEIALAEHLSKTGAKMYGAYWCPHCHDQKQLFGNEAFKKVKYLECAPDATNNQVDLCKAANLEGFPSWEINGKIYSGTKSLSELADLSGYKGPRNFQNTF